MFVWLRIFSVFVTHSIINLRQWSLAGQSQVEALIADAASRRSPTANVGGDLDLFSQLATEASLIVYFIGVELRGFIRIRQNFKLTFYRK